MGFVANRDHLHVEPQGEHQQTYIGRDGQGRQHRHRVAAGPEFLAVQAIFAHFGEELFVPCGSLVPQFCTHHGQRTLLSPEHADEQYACAIDSEQGANGVELGREDLQHNQCE